MEREKEDKPTYTKPEADDEALEVLLQAFINTIPSDSPVTPDILLVNGRLGAVRLMLHELLQGGLTAHQAMRLGDAMIGAGARPVTNELLQLLHDANADMRSRMAALNILNVSEPLEVTGGLDWDNQEAIFEQMILDRVVLADVAGTEWWWPGMVGLKGVRIEDGEPFEVMREHLRLPAALVYRQALCLPDDPEIYDFILDCVVHDGGVMNLRSLEGILPLVKVDWAQVRLRRALMRVKTDLLASPITAPVLSGYGLLSNPDAWGESVLVGCFELDDDRLMTAHLVVDHEQRIVDAIVASHRTPGNLQRLIERLANPTRQLRRVPLDEVVMMSGSALDVFEEESQESVLAKILFAMALEWEYLADPSEPA